jgi:tetratricopeptide (TPR) repeat protein
VSELYSIRDVARIFGVPESRLRYWISSGFVAASQRRGGKLCYTFEDLVCVRTAIGLLEAGISMHQARTALDALRRLLPEERRPLRKLRICSDGVTVVAVDDELAWEPATGQVVMNFTVDSLSAQLADVVAIPRATDDIADRTESHRPPTAYGFFLDGCDAEDRGDDKMAEECYRRALDLDPSLAAAHTNLGNVFYRRGERDRARAAFELALELEPAQPEARYNLGNLLDDLGATEDAIAELRRVTSSHPEFADAHYNLGLLLARVGGYAQAQKHLETYLRLDADSEWATRGRHFLSAIS